MFNLSVFKKQKIKFEKKWIIRYRIYEVILFLNIGIMVYLLLFPNLLVSAINMFLSFLVWALSPLMKKIFPFIQEYELIPVERSIFTGIISTVALKCITSTIPIIGVLLNLKFSFMSIKLSSGIVIIIVLSYSGILYGIDYYLRNLKDRFAYEKTTTHYEFASDVEQGKIKPSHIMYIQYTVPQRSQGGLYELKFYNDVFSNPTFVLITDVPKYSLYNKQVKSTSGTASFSEGDELGIWENNPLIHDYFPVFGHTESLDNNGEPKIVFTAQMIPAEMRNDKV